jgi:membrane-associated phospholipid phosphatase
LNFHKHRKTMLICFHLLLSLHRSAVWASEDQGNRNFIQNTIRSVYDDAYTVITSPARMTGHDVLRLSAFSLITAGFIYRYDRQINEAYYRSAEKHDRDIGLLAFGKRCAKIGEVYNDIKPVYFLSGLTSAILLGGLIGHDSRLVDTAHLIAESFLITGVLTTLGKGFFGRSRPFIEKGSHDFNFFEFRMRNKFLSMPSGHTSTVFSVMTVIACQYPHWWVAWPAYGFCFSVAMQRLEAHQHWASDVIVGGALGYWVGKTLVNKHKISLNKKSVYLSFLPDQVGFNIHF